MSAPSRAISVASFSVGSARANNPNCRTRPSVTSTTDRHAIDRRRRRMRFEIEQRERAQHPRIAHGRRQLHRALVHVRASRASSLDMQRHDAAIVAVRDARTTARTTARARTTTARARRSATRDRATPRTLSGDYGRHQRPRVLAARPALPSQAILPEPGGQIGGRQRGQIAERAEAPAL